MHGLLPFKTANGRCIHRINVFGVKSLILLAQNAVVCSCLSFRRSTHCPKESLVGCGPKESLVCLRLWSHCGSQPSEAKPCQFRYGFLVSPLGCATRRRCCRRKASQMQRCKILRSWKDGAAARRSGRWVSWLSNVVACSCGSSRRRSRGCW